MNDELTGEEQSQEVDAAAEIVRLRGAMMMMMMTMKRKK